MGAAFGPGGSLHSGQGGWEGQGLGGSHTGCTGQMSWGGQGGAAGQAGGAGQIGGGGGAGQAGGGGGGGQTGGGGHTVGGGGGGHTFGGGQFTIADLAHRIPAGKVESTDNDVHVLPSVDIIAPGCCAFQFLEPIIHMDPVHAAGVLCIETSLGRVALDQFIASVE